MYKFASGGTTKNLLQEFMYAAGKDPALATQRGIQYARQQGWTPEQTVQEWNQALGTNFTIGDFYRVTGLTPQDLTFAESQPTFSNFGETGGWDFGKNAVYDPQTKLIKAPGTVFQSGKDAIVSDELFWNPHSVTGKDLQKRIQDTQTQGQRAGVVITPYAVFQGKATNEQLLDEIKNSGTDFVTLDPYYLGFGPSSQELLDWTKSFIPQVNALGKEVKLVTQGFAPKGLEQQTLEHNQKMLAMPGVKEFINFGLEDAKDLQNDPNWVSIANDYGVVPKSNQTLTPATAPAHAPVPVTSSGGIAGLMPASQTALNNNGDVVADIYQATGAAPAPAAFGAAPATTGIAALMPGASQTGPINIGSGAYQATSTAPNTVATAPAGQKSELKALLPQGWQSYNPQQKIDWFNQNKVTENQLLSANAGVTKEDIDWMKGKGYLGAYPAAQSTGPVTGTFDPTNAQTQQSSVQRLVEELQRQPRRETPVPMPDSFRQGGRVRMI